MNIYKDMATVPVFSEDILAPLASLPKNGGKDIHAARCEILENALDSYFFGGRTFIFNPPLFLIYPHWRDEQTGRPRMLIRPEPAALGYDSREDAIRGVGQLLKGWGFENFLIGYFGAPESKKNIDDNEYEAWVNSAVRDAIKEKYGEEMAVNAGRMRTANRDTQHAHVLIRSTDIFNELARAGARQTGSGRYEYREIDLPIRLPDGIETTFPLQFCRDGLIPDLTRHFFGDRKFSKINPFSLLIEEDYQNGDKRRTSLIIQVSPEAIGYITEQEAHDAIRDIAAHLGYSEEVKEAVFVQSAMFSLDQIEAAESASNVKSLSFLPIQKTPTPIIR